MVEPLWGTRASPLWSGLWPCSCVQQSLPLCGVNRVSPHGPVSTRQASLAVLIEPVGRRLLPYTPWRYCRSIRPKHWETCTRVGTTWRFYMSCVLRRTSRSERRRWPHSLWVVRCPRLWSRSAISGCVSLTWRSRRRYSSWMLPCHRPAFSATLSRAVPSSFRQHRSRLRRSSTSCAGGNPLLLPLRLQPLSLLVAVGAPLWPPPLPRRGSSLPPCGVVEPVTDRTPSPSRPPPDQAASASARGPETGDPEMERTARREMVTAPLPPPEEGRVENPLFRFVFVPPLAQQPAVPKTSIKEQFPQSLGLKRRRVVYRASRDHFPPPLSPGRGGLPKSTPPAHLWNRVRAVALKPPLQVVTRKPGSCVSSHTRRNQVSVTLHTQTPPPAITGQAFTGPGPGPCVPHRCLTTGTSVAPLVPLARSLGAWLALPSPSRWLLRNIRLGYAIQFARRPPKFRGIRFTSVKPADAPVLRAEIAVLLAKDAIEPVPPADMRSGLFSPYFIVPKKGGGLRPILDHRALHKLPFKMLTQKRIFGCVRPLDWFAAIDLKDAYFHVSILPRHRPFLRFAFEGQAYQYKVLPFGLSLSPRVFTKVVEAALVPLREQGVRILNYLDDWLILAQSRREESHVLGSHVQRARSIRGLDGSPTALAYQLPRVASSTPCPEPSQRAPSAQGRSGPYGQHCDRCVYQPARRFALPSHVATRPPPPPLESEASEVPSCHPHPRSVQSGSRRAVPSSTSRRVETPSPGGSADLGTVRSCPGRPVCISRNHPLPRVLLPNRGNARHGCTGTQLAPGPVQICVPPSEPTSTDTVQDQGGRGAGLVSGSILAQQDLVPGTHAPRDSPSLANSSEEGSAFSETGHPMAPAPGPVETPRMVPGWDAEVLADLPQEVALTITSARAPSTRRAYTLKWNLFVEWCSSHQEDPRRCSIRAVLSFLQQGLERRLSPSTLKVYVAAISAYHDPVEGKSVGKHNLVVRFLRGARRLNPPRPPLSTLLGFGFGAKSPNNCPLWAFAVSRVEVSIYENPTHDCIGLDQEGGGPAGIFGRRFVPSVWAGWLQCNTEAPARLCAQGSYHSLQGPGSESASAAPGGGRPSPSFALSGTRTATVHG